MQKVPEIKEIKIAITGSIGSGKSSVAKIIRDLGYYCFSADDYNHHLMEKGSSVYDEIVESFNCVDENGNIDRHKLASIVFNDALKLNHLNRIVHPHIIDKLLKELDEHSVFFAEVPLLFELKLDRYFDYIVVVIVDEESRNRRLSLRGIGEEAIKDRLKYQLPQSLKIKNADIIIDNSGSINDLKADVKKILEILGI